MQQQQQQHQQQLQAQQEEWMRQQLAQQQIAQQQALAQQQQEYLAAQAQQQARLAPQPTAFGFGLSNFGSFWALTTHPIAQTTRLLLRRRLRHRRHHLNHQSSLLSPASLCPRRMSPMSRLRAMTVRRRHSLRLRLRHPRSLQSSVARRGPTKSTRT